MQRIFKTVMAFVFIILTSISLSACRSENTPAIRKETAKVRINDVSYNSLTEAVDGAKSGDTVKIYNDINDEKNVVINKPLSIVGMLTSNNIKPKFYGAITIDANGETDKIEIKDIEIIHSGKLEEGENNDTRFGINLIDGGLSLYSSYISLYEVDKADQDASGIIISRKADSKNTMPIVIKGNTFGEYKLSENGQNGAFVIKQNLENKLEKLNLNNDLLFKQNTFTYTGNGNQFISLSYEKTPTKIDYLVTSSSKQLLETLLSNQYDGYNTYILKNAQSKAEKQNSDIPVLPQTNLMIEGGKNDLGQNIFKVQGTINLNADLSNATFERTSSTASIINNREDKTTNVEIK